MFNIFRTKSKLHVSDWSANKIVVLELTPAIDGVSKGQPKPGEARYDQGKKCNISFTPIEMYKLAWALNKLSNGEDVKWEKMADSSKVAGNTEGEVKSFAVLKGSKGGTLVSLKSGDRSSNIILGEDETYALSRYLIAKADCYFAARPVLKNNE